MKTCIGTNCLNSFKPLRVWQKYCSKKCANKKRTTTYWAKRLAKESNAIPV